MFIARATFVAAGTLLASSLGVFLFARNFYDATGLVRMTSALAAIIAGWSTLVSLFLIRRRGVASRAVWVITGALLPLACVVTYTLYVKATDYVFYGPSPLNTASQLASALFFAIAIYWWLAVPGAFMALLLRLASIRQYQTGSTNLSRGGP